MKHFRVLARWDDDAKVWWAESDEVPGLATEAPTPGELSDNVHAIAPELLAMNTGFRETFLIDLISQ